MGSLSWTDTLPAATAWSVTLASTDLYSAAGVGGNVPFTDCTITVDQTPVGAPLNSDDLVTAGAVSQLNGTDTTSGTTYSTPITLATGSATTKGTWTEAANKISVGVPSNTIPATVFTATIQYTVTG